MPMSDQSGRTCVRGPDGWLGFQEYFVTREDPGRGGGSGLCGRERSAARPLEWWRPSLGPRRHRLPLQSHHSIGPSSPCRASRARWSDGRGVLAVSPIVEGRPSPGPPESHDRVRARGVGARVDPPTRPGSNPARGQPGRGADAADRSRRDCTHVTETVMRGREGENRPGPPGARGARVSAVVAVPSRTSSKPSSVSSHFSRHPSAATWPVPCSRTSSTHWPARTSAWCWSSRVTQRSRRWRAATGRARSARRPTAATRKPSPPRSESGPRPRGAALPHHPGRRAGVTPGELAALGDYAPRGAGVRYSCLAVRLRDQMRLSSSPPMR